MQDLGCEYEKEARHQRKDERGEANHADTAPGEGPFPSQCRARREETAGRMELDTGVGRFLLIWEPSTLQKETPQWQD